MDGCKNLKIHPQQKVRKHIPSGFYISAISSFTSIEKRMFKYGVYRGIDREHAMKIINFEKKKMKLLTNEQHKSYENAKIVIFVEKNLKIDMLKIEYIVNLEIIVNNQGNMVMLQIADVI